MGGGSKNKNRAAGIQKEKKIRVPKSLKKKICAETFQ
jgi:hypothetical protein